MENKLVQLIMFGFIGFSLLTIVSIPVDFPSQLIRSYGINEAYAKKPHHTHPWLHGNHPPGWHHGRPINPVPEPSTLVLLGTGLASGAGIYTMIKYRKRKKIN